MSEGKLALTYDVLADRYRIRRRYNRPQYWRALLTVEGIDAGGGHARSETDLIPESRIMPSAMACLSAQHVCDMQGEYSEVLAARVDLYRLTSGERHRMRKSRGSEVAA